MTVIVRTTNKISTTLILRLVAGTIVISIHSHTAVILQLASVYLLGERLNI